MSGASLANVQQTSLAATEGAANVAGVTGATNDTDAKPNRQGHSPSVFALTPGPLLRYYP